ncbi:hypothetical protein BN2497_11541 [Janthinobacterium sp. CG23_2]|nr:hypothetical protein BN2497_11541 [Janthinobacterium sp. CG23_2]CUU32168.1 hypothetical protein BN3177_11541 [Janthinobacterium sp. CG23_2]
MQGHAGLLSGRGARTLRGGNIADHSNHNRAVLHTSPSVV